MLPPGLPYGGSYWLEWKGDKSNIKTEKKNKPGSFTVELLYEERLKCLGFRKLMMKERCDRSIYNLSREEKVDNNFFSISHNTRARHHPMRLLCASADSEHRKVVALYQNLIRFGDSMPEDVMMATSTEGFKERLANFLEVYPCFLAILVGWNIHAQRQ